MDDFKIDPKWLFKTYSGDKFMKNMFDKMNYSDFVPNSTDFVVHEFFKQSTKKTSRLFQCTYRGCGKTKVSISKLFSHMFSHTKEKPYKCLFHGCNKSFGYVSNQRSHQLYEHGHKFTSSKR